MASEDILSRLKEKDAMKTSLMEEISELEAQLAQFNVATSVDGEEEAKKDALVKALDTKKQEMLEVQGEMRELGDALKAANMGNAAAPAAAAAADKEEAPAAPAGSEAEVAAAPKPTGADAPVASPSPEPAAASAPSSSNSSSSSSGRKVVQRKKTAASSKKAAGSKTSTKTSSSSSRSSSSTMSTFFSVSNIAALQERCMGVLTAGLAHRSVLLFGLSSVAIFMYGEFASV